MLRREILMPTAVAVFVLVFAVLLAVAATP